ncbi:hypothetical protein [Geminocystis herdmanii]|uniref:hypothetical protein n=1 Tax=Geminocystis herdmanii TaxID=669359 RepID=UPI000373D63F|nr:hypothetical protein [Geminocystis herdmanii]
MKIPFPKNFKPQKPLKICDYQDIMIVLPCPQIHPLQFNLEKLRQAKIIPLHWQLNKPVVKNNHLLQLIFDVGITINITIGKISFFSKINTNIQYFSEVIIQFLSNFNQYKYQKFQIFLRRFISFPKGIETASKFIKETLLNNANSWDICGQQPKKCQVTFGYKLPKSNLILHINDVEARNNRNKKYGLLFRGIFNYNLPQKSNVDKINYLISIVSNYQNNIKVFNQIINETFLC